MENILLIALYCFIFFVAGAFIVGLCLIYKELHNINDSLYNIPSNDFILFGNSYINTNNILKIHKRIDIINHKYSIVITPIGNEYKYEQFIECFDSENDFNIRYKELLNQISRFE